MFTKMITMCMLTLLATTNALGASWSGKVVHLADGDTLTVLNAQNRQVKIRLYGIDCPELRQDFGRQAKEFTTQQLAGMKVFVAEIEQDQYGRQVAIISTPQGKTIQAELLSAGLAWVYPMYCHRPVCKEWRKAEQLAHQKGKGLWKQPSPTPPWKWRKNKVTNNKY